MADSELEPTPQPSPAQGIASLARDTGIYGLNRLALSVAQIILVPLYTRVFRPAEYGVVDLLLTFQAFAIQFLLLGMDNGWARFYHESEDPADRRLTVSTALWFHLATTTFVTLALLPAARLLSKLLLGTPDNAPLVVLSVLTLLPTLLQYTFANLLKWMREPWLFAAASLVQFAASIGLAVYLVVCVKWGLAGVLWSVLLANACTGALTGLLTRTQFGLTFSRGRLREMAAFGLPFLPARLGWQVMVSADRYLLLHLVSRGTVGVYSVGSKVARLLLLPVSAFQFAWGPYSLAIHRSPNAKTTYARAFAYYTTGALLGLVLLSVFAPELVRVFAPAGYAAAHWVVPLLAGGIVLDGARYIVSVGLSITKNTRPIGIIGVAGAAINLGCSFVLIPRFGMVGAGISVVLSQLLVVAALHHVSQRCYPVDFGHWRAGILVAAAAAVSLLGQWSPPWIPVAVLCFKAGLVVGFAVIAYQVGLPAAERALVCSTLNAVRSRRKVSSG